MSNPTSIMSPLSPQAAGTQQGPTRLHQLLDVRQRTTCQRYWRSQCPLTALPQIEAPPFAAPPEFESCRDSSFDGLGLAPMPVWPPNGA